MTGVYAPEPRRPLPGSGSPLSPSPLRQNLTDRLETLMVYDMYHNIICVSSSVHRDSSRPR